MKLLATTTSRDASHEPYESKINRNRYLKVIAGPCCSADIRAIATAAEVPCQYSSF